MLIGMEVYVERYKIYGKKTILYQRGRVIGMYPHHVLVEIQCKNGNTYKESFRKEKIKYKGELGKDACIY